MLATDVHSGGLLEVDYWNLANYVMRIGMSVR